MSWTYVKGVQETSGSGTSASVSFASTVVSGDIVTGYAFLNGASSNTVTSITDDKSNSYTVVNAVTTVGGFTWTGVAFWSGGALTNGPLTITVNSSFSTSNLWITLGEFTPPAGTLSLDGNSSNKDNVGTTQPTAGSFTTTVNGDLIYCAVFKAGGGISGVGSGFTAGQGVTSDFADEFQTQTSAGSINPNWASSVGDQWTCNAFAIKAVTSSVTEALGSPILRVKHRLIY